MRNLAEFLQKYHHWFLFLILEVVSMVLLFQFNGYQGSVWFTSANIVSGKVYEVSSAVDQFFSLTKVNERLTQRNVTLERQVEYLSQQIEKLSGDSEAATREMKNSMASCRMIPARVISNTIDKQDNFITIDKGSRDGVRPDMGVVCGTGIVGIVYQTTPDYSIVIPVLSSHSRISCRIDKRGYFGYLRWDGRSSRYAYVEDVPRHAKFKRGDWVETSGYSSIFPPGVLVGKIVEVYNSRDGLSYKLKVQLSTDFGNVRDVCVISDKGIAERIRLMDAARDSMRLGNKE